MFNRRVSKVLTKKPMRYCAKILTNVLLLIPQNNVCTCMCACACARAHLCIIP